MHVSNIQAQARMQSNYEPPNLRIILLCSNDYLYMLDSIDLYDKE